jgi:hypothetical protein
MTPERIAELRALAESAVPGPWRATQYATVWSEGAETRVADTVGSSHGDARFIAAARTALPEALDAIERVRALLTRAYTAEDCNGHEDEVVDAAELLAALEGKSDG